MPKTENQFSELEKRFVMVESPYKGKVTEHTNYARKCLKFTIDNEMVPFASHLLYTQVLDDSFEVQRKQGMQLGRAWIDKVDCVLFFCDYGFSEGMGKMLYECLSKDIDFKFVFLPK